MGHDGFYDTYGGNVVGVCPVTIERLVKYDFEDNKMNQDFKLLSNMHLNKISWTTLSKNF